MILAWASPFKHDAVTFISGPQSYNGYYKIRIHHTQIM